MRYYVLSTTGCVINPATGRCANQHVSTSYSVYDSEGTNPEMARFTAGGGYSVALCRERAFTFARALNAAEQAEALPDVLLARAHA
jgi:hypothetical protein